MPSLDDNIEDLVPSTDPTLDVEAGVSTPGAEAVSSPADGENDENELLNVVRDVVKERTSSDAASPAAGNEDAIDDQGKQPDDEQFSDVPFNKHPRFQQLLRQRDNFKQGHERYENVVQYLDQHGLSAEEAADGLQVMGLMKTNPAEAWKRLRPTLEKLLVAAGEVPAPELQARVQAGELTPAAALEISRAQAQARSIEAHRKWETESGQRRQTEAQASAVIQTVSDWERDRQIKDPNFEAKREALEREIAYLHHKEGRPNTPEGVRAQLQKAYQAVNQTFRPPAPKTPVGTQRQAVKPVNGGQRAGNQQPASTEMSTLEIIRANRRA